MSHLVIYKLYSASARYYHEINGVLHSHRLSHRIVSPHVSCGAVKRGGTSWRSAVATELVRGPGETGEPAAIVQLAGAAGFAGRRLRELPLGLAHDHASPGAGLGLGRSRRRTATRHRHPLLVARPVDRDLRRPAAGAAARCC